MAGLVPAIHVVTWRIGLRTPTNSFAGAAPFLELAQRTSTWMAGTSPAPMTRMVTGKFPTLSRAMPQKQSQLPIIDFALSGVIACVGTVTTVSTLSAQSIKILFAISIASGPPVG
jgi:hypothetical protein